MKHLIKLFLAGLVLVLLAYCRPKKTTPGDLQSWLDKYYPGRFQVLWTTSRNVIRNFSFKAKRSVVAEKDQPLVQALIDWDRRDAEFGLSQETVDDAFVRAREVWAEVTSFTATMKAHQSEGWAAGIRDGTVTVLVFEESTRSNRDKWLSALEQVFAAWPAAGSYGKDLFFAEPGEAANFPEQMVPLQYWLDLNGGYRKQVIMQLHCAYDQAFLATNLAQAWQFNIESVRFAAYSDQARQAAQNWLEQQPGQLTATFESAELGQPDGPPLLLQFFFPVTNASTVVQVDLDLDRQTVTDIRLVDQ